MHSILGVPVGEIVDERYQPRYHAIELVRHALRQYRPSHRFKESAPVHDVVAWYECSLDRGRGCAVAAVATHTVRAHDLKRQPTS
eukprot:2116931-Rhodomonas_salina.1